MSATDERPTKLEAQAKASAEFLAATDALIAALMEVRSEYRDDAISLADVRHDVGAAVSEWEKFAWRSEFNPYMTARLDGCT